MKLPCILGGNSIELTCEYQQMVGSNTCLSFHLRSILTKDVDLLLDEKKQKVITKSAPEIRDRASIPTRKNIPTRSVLSCILTLE